jgi:hypothetical protein
LLLAISFYGWIMLNPPENNKLCCIPGHGFFKMNGEFTIFLLRILALLLIYAFLLAMGYLLWKEPSAKNNSPHVSSLRFIEGAETARHSNMLSIVEEMTIGRAESNSLQVEDEYISSNHARIYYREPQWWLEDLESKNGTFLNGRRLHKPTLLETGDTISFGTTRMIFYEHLNTDHPAQKEMN